MKLFRIEAVVSLNTDDEDACAQDWFGDLTGVDIKILEWHETPMRLEVDDD